MGLQLDSLAFSEAILVLVYDKYWCINKLNMYLEGRTAENYNICPNQTVICQMLYQEKSHF